MFHELKNTQKTDHFGSSFTTKNLDNLLSSNFYLSDFENKGTEFIDDEKKIHILDFKIEVLKTKTRKGHKMIIS